MKSIIKTSVFIIASFTTVYSPLVAQSTPAERIAAMGASKTLISELDSMKYDGTTLSFSYGTGGGCQKHVPTVGIELVTSEGEARSLYTAVVKVYDVSPTFDRCEANLFLSGSVNLKLLIQDAMKNFGLTASQTGNSVSVQLPVLTNKPFDN